MLGRTEAGRVRFVVRRLWTLPIVFAVLLVVSVWPGVYFVDRLIPGEWGWIPTWWWYVPLTALPAPFAWRVVMRLSAASIAASAREGIGKIAAELDGKVVGGEDSSSQDSSSQDSSSQDSSSGGLASAGLASTGSAGSSPGGGDQATPR